MMNNNFNNGNGNRDNNNTNGGFIMSTNTIKTVKDFSEVVKVAFEMRYPEAKVRVQEVQKNNNLVLTGLAILEGQANIAPTIYLNSFFEQYKAGRPMADIFEAIDEAYNEHKVECNFNVDQIMSYECVQDKICYKLINKAKNEALLQDVPYVPFMDLAVVFYITVGEFKDALGTILIVYISYYCTNYSRRAVKQEL